MIQFTLQNDEPLRTTVEKVDAVTSSSGNEAIIYINGASFYVQESVCEVLALIKWGG